MITLCLCAGSRIAGDGVHGSEHDVDGSSDYGPIGTRAQAVTVRLVVKCMTPFTWLVVGHFIGDWMLQNDWMARGKRGRWWTAPCLVHCAVYTLAVTACALAALQTAQTGELQGLCWVAGWVLTTHWLIDGFDLAHRWGKLVKQSSTEFVRIVVDQTMHILALAIAALFIGGTLF
ncbi:MAG: DUF3307 domain-containing protein [Anaerolineales bacterium]|nr:DUF3307 domain-containing protein [Anaerolineales bacterium]